MFYSVFFSGLVYTMFFVYILHACFYSEVFLLLPTHTLIKKNYLHLLVLHKRWEVRAVRQRWHRAYAEVPQSICRGGTSMKMAELHKSNRMDWPDGCQ